MELEIGDILFYKNAFDNHKECIVGLVITNERYYKSGYDPTITFYGATVKWINRPWVNWSTFADGWTSDSASKKTPKVLIQRVKHGTENR